MMLGPQIETGRLLLRQLSLDDADDYYHAIMKDPDVRRYLPGGAPLPRAQAESILSHFIKYWKVHGIGGFAVIHKADIALIGQAGLQYVPGAEETVVEVYYGLAKAYWGQGLAPEAARACLRYGFETLGFERIIALYMPENTASQRVMIKLGMSPAGVMRAYNDELPYYAMTREAFAYGGGAYALRE